MASISADVPTTIGGLRKPAYNDVVNAEGRYSYCQTLNAWERFMQAIA